MEQKSSCEDLTDPLMLGARLFVLNPGVASASQREERGGGRPVRQSRASLCGLELKYRTLFDHAADLVVVLDPQGNLLDLNRTFEQESGYDRAEMVGKNVFASGLLTDSSAARAAAYFKDLLEGRECPVFEVEGVSKEGDLIPYEIKAIPIRNGTGIVAVQAVLRNITERRSMEKASKESYGTLVTVLDSIDADVYVADMESHELLFINKHMQDSFGKDLVGKPCYREFKGKSAPCEDCSNSKLLNEQGIPTGVFLWEDRNPVTGRWYVNCDRAVRWTNGRFVRLQVATDVTRLKQAEEDKRRLEAQLLKAQRAEALGTLAGGIAHNFNNLLMGIQGYTSLMLLKTEPDHPHYKMLKTIEKQIHSGSKLTAQLLGYARAGRFEVRPVNLNRIVEEMSDTFGIAKKEIRIRRNLAPDLLGIRADQGQIEQALLNLCVNAADAMPDGGDLFLSTRNVEREEADPKSPQPGPGKYVLLEVRDTGTGMDERTRERIFEPFFTTKGLVRGTGLGLASVYGIVKGHGGYIEVVSSPGQGTTFSLYLPASCDTQAKKFLKDEAILKGHETVLIVDDEKQVLEVGNELLKSLGYRVILAGSGKEAVDIYRAQRDRIDMVILDMIMPGMSGGETYDRLREIDPHVKVLLASGYSVEGQATEILGRGCNGFIQKPFGNSELSRRLREVLGDPAPPRPC